MKILRIFLFLVLVTIGSRNLLASSGLKSNDEDSRNHYIETLPNSILVNERVKFVPFPQENVTSLNWKLDDYPEVTGNSKAIDFLVPDLGHHKIRIRAQTTNSRTIEKEISFNAITNSRNCKTKILSPSGALLAGSNFIFSIGTKCEQNIVKINWNFGDGTSTSGKSLQARHTYKFSGNFVVTYSVEYKNLNLESGRLLVSVANSSRILTVADQVVLDIIDQLETVSGQTTFVPLSVYAGSSKLSSYSTPTWNVTGGLTVVSTASNGAEIGGTTGTVTAVVDGVSSQTISISQPAFTTSNELKWIKRGGYVGTSRPNMCYYVNASVGTPFVFLTDKSSYYGITSSGINSSSKVGSCFKSGIPSNEFLVTSSALNQTTSIQYQPTSPLTFNKFIGRGNFLYFRPDAKMQIEPDNSHIASWDHDFSITYWTTLDQDGNQLFPNIDSAFKLEATQGVSHKFIKFTDLVGEQFLSLPVGSDFQDRWINVGITFNSSSKIIKIYFDGKLIGARTLGSPRLSYDSLIDFHSASYQSSLDEVRFWDKELSSSEVLSEMFSPQSNSSNDLYASFSFDSAGQGNYGSDGSGNWKFHFNSEFRPQFILQPQTLFTGTIPLVGDLVTEFKIPFYEFGNSSFGLIIPQGSAANQPFSVDFASCEKDCVDELSQKNLKEKRISPYVFFKPVMIQVNPFLMKLPFNSMGLTSNDLDKVKIYTSVDTDPDPDVYMEYPSLAANFQKGSISAAVPVTGTAWASVIYESPFTNTAESNFRIRILETKANVSKYKINILNRSSGINLDFTGFKSKPESIYCLPSNRSYSVNSMDSTVFLNASSTREVCRLTYLAKSAQKKIYRIDDLEIAKGDQ